jgi:hypothetical protein
MDYRSALHSSASVTRRYTCHPQRYIVTKSVIDKKPARHHQYPSWVTCSVHVTVLIVLVELRHSRIKCWNET